jgi:hypothetical protein
VSYDPNDPKPVESAEERLERRSRDAADAALLRGELEVVLARWSDLDVETRLDIIEDLAQVVRIELLGGNKSGD